MREKERGEKKRKEYEEGEEEEGCIDPLFVLHHVTCST